MSQQYDSLLSCGQQQTSVVKIKLRTSPRFSYVIYAQNAWYDRDLITSHLRTSGFSFATMTSPTHCAEGCRFRCLHPGQGPSRNCCRVFQKGQMWTQRARIGDGDCATRTSTSAFGCHVTSSTRATCPQTRAASWIVTITRPADRWEEV